MTILASKPAGQLPRIQALIWGALVLSSLAGCAGDKEPDPDLENVKGDQEANSQDDNAEAAPKQAIADNGYDDDWNNIGSQQQKQQQAANKNPKQEQNNAQNNNLALNNEDQQQAQNQVNNANAVNLAAEPPLDPEPAPVADLAEPPPPPPVAAPIPEAPVVSGAPLLRKDVEPLAATLYWVGYDFAERDGLVRIEMVTRGSPKFNLFQERNQADQPELVVRFFNTRLRDKVRRDVDASEFRSPVAFVRMRPNDEEMCVDVVLTLRDAVQPRMFTKNGNVMLTFPIPDHYFGNSMIGSAPVAKAEVIPNANIMPEIDQGSDIPEGMKIARAFINDPADGAFPGAPADGGLPVDAPPTEPLPGGDGGLPADFSGNQVPANNQFLPVSENPNGLEPSDDQMNFSENGNNGDDLDGEPAANQQDEGQYEDEENDNDSEDENDQQQLEDDDSLDDFDNGDGESESDIDKYDVRLQELNTRSLASFKSSPFSLVGVAQDDQEQESNENNQAADDNDFGNGDLNSENQQGGQGNFQGAPAAEQNGNLLGEGGQGNAPINTQTPAQAFPGFNQTAPENGGVPLQAAPQNPALAFPANQEPPLEGTPDLAGPETVGIDTGAATPPSGGGRPIKLDFRDAPLKEVIRVLGDETGVNFMVPNDVGEQRVYVNLSGVPFNDALKALLETNQLGMVEIGPNLVRIDTLAHIAQDKQSEETRRRAEKLLSPTKILVHRLSYARATLAAPLLGQMLGAAAELDKRVTVQVDERSNSVIVNAGANDLVTIKALLERIDLETPQVKIASRIVEVLKKMSSNFGISWAGPINFDAGRGLGFGNLPFPNQMVSRYSVDAGGLADKPGNFQAHIGSISDSVSLDLALSMEESRGTTEILQSSNLIVEDNTEALISAGSTDIFLQVLGGASGQAATALEVRYNLEVKVTPHVTGDGAVGMDLKITNDAPAVSSAGNAAAAKLSRVLNTKLLRRSGETAVIGGVYTSNRNKNTTGIPFLSSLPIIGALFRSSGNSEEKRELLVMVTPTILSTSKSTGEQAAAGDVALNQAQSLPNENGGQGQENFNLSENNQAETPNAISQGQGQGLGQNNQQGNNNLGTNNQNSQTGGNNQNTQNNQSGGNQTENDAFEDQEDADAAE